jgi:hypothetical protein
MRVRPIVPWLVLIVAILVVPRAASAACILARPSPTEAVPTQPNGQRFSFVATNDCETLEFTVDGSTISKVPTPGAPVGFGARQYSVALSADELTSITGSSATTVAWTITGATASGETVPLATTNEIDLDGDGSTRTGSDCDDADGDVFPGATELCDDVRQDCSNADWALDEGVATFYPASGGWEDWTAELAAGMSGAPALVDLSDDGELVICDGTWYVDLYVTGHDVAITGLHGSAYTVLSGGGETAVLEVVQDSTDVVATGLTMTDGNGCFGVAVTTMDILECSPAGATGMWMNDVTLALIDVRIEGNRPTNRQRTGVVGVANTMLTLDGTTIANNSDLAVRGSDSHIICNGDRSSDAGVWGNMMGVFIHSDSSADPATFESNGCDFEGVGGRWTPRYDVRVESLSRYETYRFRDDQTFSCDTATRTCVR